MGQDMKEVPLKRILMVCSIFSSTLSFIILSTACSHLKPTSTKSTPAPTPHTAVEKNPEMKETSPQDPKVFNAPDTQIKAEFIKHTEEKPFKAYLAMNLPYAPYQSLLEQVQRVEGVTLSHRGEAHVTVITPVEYDRVLKKYLSIDEIHKIAEEAGIQNISVTPVCIGRGQKEIKGKMEKTYYVVMESPGLVELRGRIEDAYLKKGGKSETFIPERYTPHVTLGFTLRDLHAEDGLVKNSSSCIYQFANKNP